MRYITIAVIVAVACGGAFIAVAQQADTPAKPIPPQSRPAQVPAEAKTIKEFGGPAKVEKSYLIQAAPLKTDYVLGKRNAPLVMVEYASLSCPHCAEFSSNVLPELEKKYIDTGKLAYILRQFPLNEPAMRGAMLVDCVGETSEEQYYVFSRVLFDAQKRWAFDTNFMSGLETIATVGGLSKARFKGCMEDKEREMKVLQAKKDTNDALKIPHTPYIFIGGEVYEGDRTAEAVSKFIDAKLSKMKK
ncbi:MAG: thioredoxin domain-containing protein [Alphaproteobacteria bacterium]|nr:thioredoxin domain-containing protein [Alphaproteobacteria bacterium]